MKKISFETVCKNHVLVYSDDEEYGSLDYDADQKAGVLWPNDIDDGVTYWESLKESEDQIEFELTHN